MSAAKKIALFTILIVLLAAAAVWFNMNDKADEGTDSIPDASQNNQPQNKPNTYTTPAKITEIRNSGAIVVEIPFPIVINQQAPSPGVAYSGRTVLLLPGVVIVKNTFSGTSVTQEVLDFEDLDVGMDIVLTTSNDPELSDQLEARQVEVR